MIVWKDETLWCELEENGKKYRFFKDDHGYAVLNEVRYKNKLLHPEVAEKSAFNRAAKAMNAKVAA